MAVDVAVSSVNLDHLYAKTQEDQKVDNDLLVGGLGDWSLDDDDLLSALFAVTEDKSLDTSVESPRSDSSSSDSYLTPISPDSAYLSPSPPPDVMDLDPNYDVVSTTSNEEMAPDSNFLIDMNIDWTDFNFPEEVFNSHKNSSDSELSSMTSKLPAVTSTTVKIEDALPKITVQATAHSTTPTSIVSSICAPTTSSSTTKSNTLVLSEEEKTLLNAEGITLPTNTTLTKAEEKILKKVRRKIKNKQSAQESRKKKKFYVDGLESRVKACTDENQALIKKVEMLENQNKSLLQQLKNLQTLIATSHPNKTQAGTCLMVLMLAFGLVFFPVNNVGKSDKGSMASYAPVNVRSRTLLQVNEDYIQAEEGLGTGSKYSSINVSDVTLETNIVSPVIDSSLSDINVKVVANKESEDGAKKTIQIKTEKR